jgi:fatty-acyl-CoA synthase
MRGLMMDVPLMISSLIRHADRWHGDTEIVSRTVEGPIHRYTYRDAHRRARQLANALERLGVQPGDRVGTLAWSTNRHFELYYGVSGIGAVIHTINPRLFFEQIAYIVDHAEDGVLFFDTTFTPIVERLAAKGATVRAWVAMTDRAHMPDARIEPLLCYEELVAAETDGFDWPQFDENTASSLCYTSGTTGHPKGVLFSHRSTVLHAYANGLPDTKAMSARTVTLPVVPMFHVNAWGLPYTGPLVGAKLVFPGPGLDPANLYELIEGEKVDSVSGVPTVWLALIQYMRERKLGFSTLKSATVGGAACPAAMLRALTEEFGVHVIHGWGMTELSPVGAINMPKAKHAKLAAEDRFQLGLKQGRPLYGIDMKIVDGSGRELPHDGKSAGDLLVRGPWVVRQYFKNEGGDPLTDDGWLPTGDVGTIDADGYLQITDRSKDVIKSGGEWISSIDLENIAMSHSAIAEAAVIGVAHPKWGERPLLIAVKKSGVNVTARQLIDFYADKAAKWSVPADVVFVDELPHTATGKLSKLTLRERFRDYKLPA